MRTSALAQALAPSTIYHLLVYFENDRLIAVAGHHPEILLAASGTNTFQGTEAVRLQLLAISTDDQGRRLADGRRLSHLVMDSLIAEAMNQDETAILTAIVARENLRSIALCERHGLTSQIVHDPRHVRLTGHFSRRA